MRAGKHQLQKVLGHQGGQHGKCDGGGDDNDDNDDSDNDDNIVGMTIILA